MKPPSSSSHKPFILTHLIPSITSSPSCSICLNELTHPAVITICLHAYCTSCIHKWTHHKRICPLCNAHFTSLFVDINLDSMTFRTQHLSSPLKKPRTKIINNSHSNNNGFGSFGDDGYRRRRDFVARQRVIGMSREVNGVNGRKRQLPKQRSFGRLSVENRGVRDERIRQWRASIYMQKLIAVPCPTRKPLEQVFLRRNSNKEMLLKRIEPWIHRELHAVLGDPNPAILVHLVTSLFISSLEETHENNYLERLQPFLLKRTSTFWHELRCFAESSLNMETYDTVVKYEKAPT